MRLSKLLSHYRSAIWFVIIGAGSGAVYFATIFLLIETLVVDYRLAASIAYAVALVVHFFANRLIAFQARDGSIYVHLMRYGAMITLNYLVTMLIVIGAVNLLSISVYAGAVAAIAVNMISNYGLSKYWIFRERRTSLQE